MTDQERDSLVALPLGEFLDRLAARSPTPGGGAVAGVAGALSCALGCMVGAYSIGKKTSEADRVLLEGLLHRVRRAEGLLRSLVDEDAKAYAAYAELAGRQDQNEETVRARAQALDLAITVPLGICAAASDCLEVFEELATKAGRMMLSDLEAAAILAEATVRCAGCSVRVNTAMVRDRARADQTLGTLERIAATARRRLEVVTAAIARRVQPRK